MNNHHPETTSAGGKKPRPNGGSAFPTDGFKYSLEHGDHQTGMSLRDYFAAKALPAIISASSAGQHSAGVARGMPPDATIEDAIAADAYAIADAMLLARDK